MAFQTQSESQLYNFNIIPQCEIRYFDDSNWGYYTFSTKDDIPYCEIQNNPFSESDNNMKIGRLIGKVQKLFIGSEYKVTARISFNKKYNNYSYEPTIVSAVVPKTLENQKMFLEAIITQRQAEILLEAYPNIVNDVLNGNDKIDLNQTKGIKDYTWGIIKEKILENYVISDILTMLQPLGVTFSMIRKLISNEPNPELLKQKLLDNPYMLTSIDGLGFKRVDALALKLVPELRVSFKRTYAYIKYFLYETGESDGHTWVNIDVLSSGIRDNIIECEELYEQVLEIERKTKALLYFNEDKVGLMYFRNIEENIFEILNNLNIHNQEWNINIENGIKEAEKEQGFKFTNEQIEIIKNTVNDNVVLITGKAGTGKSTIARAILKIYKNYFVGCAALSAKAAQRIHEATGFPASTIHRLLGAKGLNEYTYNQDNPLLYDIILIDECSMINAKLYYDLLCAIRPGTKIIMCGDARQLPPIGFGNIFSDLLERDDCFNINKLTKVLRQAEMSGILSDANQIRDGINPIIQPELKIIHGELQDMYYMFRDNRDALHEIAIKMYIKSIETEGLDEVIIVTPRKKDCINSTKEINTKIQNILISDDVPMIQRGDKTFKLGAKVIQRVNNYDKNIFNGEIGYVTEIWKERDMDMFNVQYLNKLITYNRNELDQMDLAYSLTCHLTQGSGYKTVIGIIDNTHYALLDSCLLYTLITRAKKRCLLLAEPSAFKKCIENNKSIIRQTWLKSIND
jgi:exodeoxyribonuclease V alpha subunit